MSRFTERATALLRREAAAIYPHAGIFVLGDSQWRCRFGVTDPTERDAASLQPYDDARNLMVRDLRLLHVHPDDILPYPGTTTPFDDGLLEVLEWGQQSDATGQRKGLAVLRRP